MVKKSIKLTETTDSPDLAADSAFDDALKELRIGGSVLLDETYAPPWAIYIPEQARLRERLGLDPQLRIVPFHLVRRGRFELRMPGDAPLAVHTDEVVICPSGRSHRMLSGSTDEAVSIERLLAGEKPFDDAGDRAYETELVCGVFILRATPISPLLNALPPVLTVRTAGLASSPILTRTADLLGLALERDSGTGASFTADRLLEIFFAEAIRAYRPAATTGWFAALRDDRIAAALDLVHRDPGAAWSGEALARSVALSPSRFAARFRDGVGETVMAYVKRTRVRAACRLLDARRLPVEDVAHRVGYGSAVAFNRAFRDLLGVTPGQWRASR